MFDAHLHLHLAVFAEIDFYFLTTDCVMDLGGECDRLLC